MSESSRELSELDLSCLWHPLLQHRDLETGPRIIDRGEGCFVFDSEGNRWLDGVSGLWCVNVGHGREELADVAREQMAKLAYSPLTMSHAPAIRLAAKLVQWLGYPGKVFFSNSGSEANEAAFKIARQYHVQKGSPARTKIIARHRGYHGATLGALSATGQPERREGYGPFVPGFVHIPAPDTYRVAGDCAEALEQAILREGADTVAAFIMEPIIAGGGVVTPPDDYLPRVREICTRHGVLLILDEVVTAFCRTGARFAHTHWGVEPDILTLAKGIASGYQPMGATVAKDAVFEAFLAAPGGLDHFRHVNTYGGHPVAAAVALRNLEIMERERLDENARVRGAALLERLQRLREHPNVGDVRGRGLLLGIELVEDRQSRTPMPGTTLAAIVQRCAENGVIVGRTNNAAPEFANVLILAPPLILGDAEIDLLVHSLEDALLKVLPADAPAR